MVATFRLGIRTNRIMNVAEVTPTTIQLGDKGLKNKGLKK